MKLLGVEMPFEEFDRLICEQNKGKQLKLIDGKVIAVDPEPIKVSYEDLVVEKIREKYSLNQELAILRQRDSKPDEFKEYNDYVEECKIKAKEETNGE